MAALVNVAVLPTAPASAATALRCDVIYGQQGAGSRNIWAVDQSTGQITSVGQIQPAESSTFNFNALGLDDIDGDGLADRAIGILPLPNNGRSIYRYTPSTGATTKLGNGVAGAVLTHGAINPATGHYYYGGFLSGQLRIYGFNTATNTSMGLVAQGNVPSGNNGVNGDWAFDSQGNLFVVGGGDGANIVSVVKQDLPTAAGSPFTITGTKLADIATPADKPLTGIAFSSTGYLFVSGADQIFKVNPTTGAVVGTMPMTGAGSVDMASCASPSTITVQKNFPEGRTAAGDQVTLSITGGGLSTANTATTAGSASGIQPQEAGPVMVLAGQTYSVAESGSGTGSPAYASSWQCVDATGGTVLAAGDGSQGSFVMPDGGARGISAVCTFTNRANRPGISLEKSVDSDDLVRGSTITYSFRITNTGNLPLSDIGVAEGDFTGSGELSDIECPAGAASLAPGDSVTCTATYEITQADVDRGSIENTATAHGTPPGSADSVVSAPSETTIPSTRSPGLSLVKSVDTDELIAGSTITYSFVITNTGNVTLANVGIDEGAFTGTGAMSAPVCEDGAASLAPGEQVTCTATYEVQQADVDRGSIENTATAVGAPPGGGTIASDPSDVRIPQDPAPGISVVKTSDRERLVAGQTITYTFEVTNTGNVTLTDVTVDEGNFTGSGTLSEPSCEAGISRMLPGAKVTCTASSEVTQTDVDRGSIDNTATASGNPPTGDPVTSDPSTVQVFAAQTTALSLEKSADTEQMTEAGQTIAYSFVITNTGNVTLTDVGVAEGDFTGSGALSEVECPAGAASLAPGQSVTCTASYEVTQADVDRGSVENTATAAGTAPGGDRIASAPSEVKIPQDPRPALALVKRADTQKVSRAGQVVHYTFSITNTGNVTLRDVNAREGEFTGNGTPPVVACPDAISEFLPGQTVVCTAAYTVVAKDLTGAPLLNVATALATPPGAFPAPVSSPPSQVTIETVKGTDGLLSNTGGDWSGAGIGWAALLIAGGFGSVLVSRRRARTA